MEQEIRAFLQSWKWNRPHILVAALIGATIFKLYLAMTTLGSPDPAGFLDQLGTLRVQGVGTYRVRGVLNSPFNHPPPMIHIILLWGWLADTTGVPFQFWVRLPSVLADVGNFLLVARWLSKLWPDRRHFGVLLALALCPAAIVISGYHGNTDSVMIFLLLLSLYLVEMGRAPWLAGLIFGLSVCVKVAPLAFAPAICLYMIGWRRRLAFFGAGALTFVVCSLPYLAEDPKTILTSVFGYASIYGRWGWTQLAVLTFPTPPIYLHRPYDVQGSHFIFATLLKYLSVVLICAASFWLSRRQPRPSLLIQGGLVIAIVLLMAPGFGIQYLIWLVPFVPALGLRPALLYFATTAIYVVGTYSCSFGVCFPLLFISLFALMCWLSIFAIVLTYRRVIRSQTPRG